VATGCSIARYVKGRRLTEAAKLLAEGAPDILAVALEVGYNSHEAFSRAFRDQFGTTPETVRTVGHLDNIQLVEAIKMEETLIELEAPRLENGRAIVMAGLSERYDNDSSAGIPAQWQRFVPYLGSISGQMGRVAYGVISRAGDTGLFDYLCGVEVSDAARVPEELVRLRIPEQRYVVFTHRDHISRIRSTFHTIFNRWLPDSEFVLADAATMERYGEEFDPRSGFGGVEIWVPVM
jgi:AraC family transcriptional regulator